MGSKGKLRLLRNNKATISSQQKTTTSDMDEQPRLLMDEDEGVEREENNIVINMEEDDDDDDDDDCDGQLAGDNLDDDHDRHATKHTDNHYPRWKSKQHAANNSKQQQHSPPIQNQSNSQARNDRESLLEDLAPDQLVWFDPNLFGYSIPGKIVDFHPELQLLTVEAFSQPPVTITTNEDSEDIEPEVEFSDAWIQEYTRNWFEADASQSELQLYQLSEPNQLACLRRRAPLGDARGCADLVDLPELLPESIVWNLKVRSSLGLVYTQCGAKILISVNPNEQMPQLYNLDQVNRYAIKLCHQQQTHSTTSSLFKWLLLNQDNKSTDELTPHIFNMAKSAIKQLLISGQDQCFVLLGECGSGKSEACKLLIQYVAATSNNKSTSNQRLAEQLLESQQILESFGNAARRHNVNSSRFAKLVTLQVSLDTGLLISAQTNDLKLLDKSRIVVQQARERNYHIFYELLAGLKQQERERYGLQAADKYFYLNQGQLLEVMGKNDGDDFRALQRSMQVLGFSHDEQDTCFRILASILHLGNIYFNRRLLAIRTGKLATHLDHTSSSSANNSTAANSQPVEGVDIGSDTEVRWVSHLLQIQFESVMQCLCMRTSSEPSKQNQNSTTRERIVTPLNIDQALDARDALARSLYTCLFRWLLERLNAVLVNPTTTKQHSESLCEFQPGKLGLSEDKQRQKKPLHQAPGLTAAQLVILDCFGFENLSENNFEQLCINLAAELLQNHTRRYLIKLELIEYERESLNWLPTAELELVINQPSALVSLLARKPLGILPLLDDECNFPKGTDVSFMEKCHHNHAVNKNYIRSQRDQQHQGSILCEFGIRHFGQDSRIVFYQTDGFIEKNRDCLRPDLVELVQSSSSPLIRSMMSKFLQHPTSMQPTSQSVNQSTPATVLHPDNTTRTLTRTHDGRYVCMKPRQTTVSARFQEALASNRVIESLNPQQHAAPANVWFIACLKPNRIQAPAKLFDVAFVQEQVGCLNLLELAQMRQSGYPVRIKNQEFVRRYQCLIDKCQVSLAEACRHKRTLRDLSLDIIDVASNQLATRAQQHQFGLTKVFMSECLYKQLENKRLERYQKAICIMQRTYRMWLVRRQFLAKRRAACLIQANLRAFQQRELYRRQKRSIVFCQRRWRQIMLKRRHERLEAKRKAKRAQQLKQLQDLQAQHARKQASQLRFRLQQPLQLDIPEELAKLYRDQRNWLQANKNDDVNASLTPSHRSLELENYTEISLGALQDQEAKRVARLARKLHKRSQDYPQAGSLLSVPFLALIEPLNQGESSRHSMNSDHHEILAHTIEQFKRDFSTRLQTDNQLASNISQLEKSLSIGGGQLKWDERYSLKQFVDQFYPIEAPQFGYSRLPITKPFSWHSLACLRADWLRNAPSKFAAQQITSRFELLKTQSIAMYKLMLRYIDSNHTYIQSSSNNLEDPDNYHYASSSIHSGIMPSNNNYDLKHMIKFKLMADYLQVLCLKEPLLRQEFYLQLTSLSWQNPKPSSQNNLWKLMLNCLASFGPDNSDLTCYLLHYVNDYCLNKQYRPLLLGRLAIWLVSKAAAASPQAPCCPTSDTLVNQQSSLLCQRTNPVTMVEYMANDRLISRLMLPVSAFMDDVDPHQQQDDNAYSRDNSADQTRLNYSMRTLVELQPTDNAELIARRALQARNVPASSLVGWSLEIQHQASALNDFSCRLRGDESPLDYLARLEMLPELLELVDAPLAWELGAAPANAAEQRISAAYSMLSSTSQRRDSMGARNSHRRLSTQSQLTVGSAYPAACRSNRFSCCSSGSCNRPPSTMISSSSVRKRRNSSSGIWSATSTLNNNSSCLDDNCQLQNANAWSPDNDAPAGEYSQPLPDYDYDDPQQYNHLQRVAQRRPPVQHPAYFRQHRRSMSVQDLSVQHPLARVPIDYYNNAKPGDSNSHYQPPMNARQISSGDEPTMANVISSRRRQHQRRLSASSLNHIHKQSGIMQAGYKTNALMSMMMTNNNNNNEEVNFHHAGGKAKLVKQASDAISTDWDLTSQKSQLTELNHQQLSTKMVDSNGRLLRKKKQQQHDVISSSAMSDTSEAPSLASHVRDIKVPQNQGSQADVDRYLDELFRPMLNEAELDELTDARSLATSIRGTKAPEQATSSSAGELPTDDYEDKRESRVLSPTFESLLRGLTDTSSKSYHEQESTALPAARRSTTPSLETDLKSMNFSELKALNERLETEIQAARSNRLSSLIGNGSSDMSLGGAPIPEPPPQPDFNNSTSQVNGDLGVAGVSDDLYSRAKTIRIGKWRWPPALTDLLPTDGANEQTSEQPTEPDNQHTQQSPEELSPNNVGRVKISSEMKAKLEQLTVVSSNPKASQETSQQDQINDADNDKSTVKQLAQQRRRLLERQLIAGAGAVASCSSRASTSSASDRLSQELGAFGGSGKVLAAKQQLAAAAGLDLASLHSSSCVPSNAGSGASSRRTSSQVTGYQGASDYAASQQLGQMSEEKVESVNFVEDSVSVEDNDEVSPKSCAPINQQQAFHGNINNSDDLQTANISKIIESPRDSQDQQLAAVTKKFLVEEHTRAPSAQVSSTSAPTGSWVSSRGSENKVAADSNLRNDKARSKMPEDVLKKSKDDARRNYHQPKTTTKDQQPRLAAAIDLNNNTNNSNADICLSYANINWQARVRKEFFLPSETYDDPQVLQLLFTQLVADVFNPRQWTRLNTKERALIKALMKDHSIGYSDRLPQIGELDQVKLELIRMARSFGLYFTRSYPAQNLACLANDLLMQASDLGMDDSELFGCQWEALSLMRHLLFENRLGLVWVDMVALHHTGVRLLSVVGGGPAAIHQDQAAKKATKKQGEQPVGYKVIELLKYRDMAEVVALSPYELLLGMANGRRSWILSMDQAAKVASMLNWLHADYRASRGNKIYSQPSVVANGNDRASTEQVDCAQTHTRQSDVEQPLATAAACYTSAAGAPEADGDCHYGSGPFPGDKQPNSITRQQQQQAEKTSKLIEQVQDDALLAARLVSDANRCEQRQIAPRKPTPDSVPPPNDACPSPGANVSHYNRAQINHHQQQRDLSAAEQSSHRKQQRSASELGASGGELFGSLATAAGAQGASLSNSTKHKTNAKQQGSLSAWHRSLSRMSSKVSLFSNSTASGQRLVAAGDHSSARHNSTSSINDERQQPDDIGINYATTTTTTTTSMSVAESMKIGLDTWIECKPQDLDQQQQENTTDATCPGEAQASTTNCEPEASSTSPELAIASAQPETQYSLLQFALYNFREALDKYGADGGTRLAASTLGKSTSSSSSATNGGSTRTLRGSLKLFETLRRGSSGSKLKQQLQRQSQLHQHEWTWRELAQMVKHTCEPIKHSLLRLQSDELDKRAIECFAAILQYTGDLNEEKQGLKLLEGGEIECVYLLLMNCHNFVALRDEVYAQLMKQTTSNRSPNADSCLRAWRLFSIVAAFFACSDQMRPYLINYLETAAFDKRRAYCSVALICLQNLRKTFKYRGRKNVPSVEEIAATSAGRNSKRQIYRLPGGTERVINTRSSTVVEDIIHEICSTMLNVTDPLEMLEFSLYCIADGCDPYTMPLNREDYILDVTTELIKKHQQYVLIFCRSIWFYPLRLDSQLYIELIFNQIAPDYLEGLFLILPGDYTPPANTNNNNNNKQPPLQPLKLKRKLVKQISRLAALLHRSSGTDHLPKEDELRYLLPKPILSAMKLNNSDDVIEADADQLPAALANGANQCLIATSDKWLQFVQQDWSQMTTLDPLDAKAQFLQIIHHWPLFGCSFFACNLIQRDLLQPVEFILALNKLGIHMLDMQSHQMVHKYSFNEIISTRKVRSEDGAMFLDLKCGNSMKRTIIRLQTDQAHEISRLIKQYIDIEFLNSQPPTCSSRASSQHQQQHVSSVAPSTCSSSLHDNNNNNHN